MGWPNNYVQGVYNALGSLIGVADGIGGSIGLLDDYTWATKPLASAGIGRIRVTDIGGGTIWVSNGTRWYPEGGRITLYRNLNSTTPVTCATETQLVKSNAIPAGVIQNGDSLRVYITAQKSSTVETAVQWFRLGSNGTVADNYITAAAGAGMLSATQLSLGTIIEWKRMSATTMQKLGAPSTVGTYSGQSTAVIAAPYTVENLDTTQTYLQYSCDSSASTETYSVIDYVVELITQVA
jgi:hypothetical protein